MNVPVSKTAPAGYLEVLNGSMEGRLFPLGIETVIGRQDDSAIHADYIKLPETGVSRRHTRIFMRNGSFYVEDLNSTNGTFLNAFRLIPRVPCQLKEGGNLQIGNVHFRFRPAGRIGAGGHDVFDVSINLAGTTGQRQGEISMILVDPAVAAPEVSLMLDAREVVRALDTPLADESQINKAAVKRLQAMTKISILLGAETNKEVLFSKVMGFVFDLFPTAERAFIVLRAASTKDSEEFIPAAASTRVSDGQPEKLALSRSIIHEVVSKKHSILSLDAGMDQRFESQDSIAGLSIRSVMCAPLLIDDAVSGLIQVDSKSQSGSFNREDLQVLTGIAAQVAIALKNFNLYDEIENLFEGFVTASVHAIEARDPTTAGHSFRVADYTERLALAVDRSDRHAVKEVRFNRDQMRELRYAALLHDFGKVGVRENVLVKGKKLYPQQLELVQCRFHSFKSMIEAKAYRELVECHCELNPADFKKQIAVTEHNLKQEVLKLEAMLNTILHANEPTVIEKKLAEDILLAAHFQLTNHDGEKIALLTDCELEALSQVRGSLTDEERKHIQTHVSHTYAFLRHIPWTGSLAGIPDIAHAHHEKLDGSGYPLGLKGEDIPVQAKIMTIADIFDALTSGDRPYKSSLSPEQALDILVDEGRRGKIETQLVDIFIESKSYLLQDVH